VTERFLDGYLPYLLQRADQLLSAAFHDVLREREIQISEWRVLAVLREDGPLSVGALSERAMLPQPTTSHAVARLEREAYVERRAARGDGRLRIVALSRAGRIEADRLVTLATDAVARTAESAQLTVDAEFVAQLRDVIAALEAREASTTS
jgi:MarR family transcriptional regulator, organic hydroperoxide resistance regulator